METERQNRVRFLLRKSAGERKKPEYRERLATLFGGKQIDFLPLEESDAVRERFLEWARAQESKPPALADSERVTKRVHNYANNELLQEALLKAHGSADSRNLFVFLPDGDCTGAIILSEKVFLSHATTLLKQFNEMIYAVDPQETTHAIMVDSYDDSFRRSRIFEATLYGSATAILGARE